MTVTVIVFFHAVITVENETIFTKAEKYPHIIFHSPNIRQLMSEKIIKQLRKATAVTCRTTSPICQRTEQRERGIEKQKKEPKKSKRQREREYMSVINQSYQSIFIHLTIDVLPRGGQKL